MFEPLLRLVDLHAVSAAVPMGESLVPVIEVALALAVSAISAGAGLAHWLTRGRREDLQQPCRLHDWIRLDEAFVCARCNYQLRSHSPRSEVLPPI